jgi:hypothetical protein
MLSSVPDLNCEFSLIDGCQIGAGRSVGLVCVGGCQQRYVQRNKLNAGLQIVGYDNDQSINMNKM